MKLAFEAGKVSTKLLVETLVAQMLIRFCFFPFLFYSSRYRDAHPRAR